MADLAQRVPALLDSKAVIGGMVFMFVGLGIKMALMPLHGWLPDAYSSAPDSVSPLLSALVTKVSLLAWARILYWAVGVGGELEITQILRLVWGMGALASVVGAFLALTQRDVKRIFAYGGLSHIGLILIGVGQGNQTGLAGAMFYLINDAVMQATLFVVAGAAIHQYGIQTFDELGRSAWARAVDDRGAHHRGHVDDRHTAHGWLFREVVHHFEQPEGRQLPCRCGRDDFHTPDAGLSHQTVGAGLCRRSRVGEH